MEVLSLLGSSTLVVDRLSSHGREVPFRKIEVLYLHRVKYCSSRRVVTLWMNNSFWEVEILSLIEMSTVVVDELLPPG